MFKIASVIVDNTAKEVDREFDYLIPSQYAEIIKVGMRVIVPFGGTNKYIEGYILNFKKESDYPVQKLKSIQDIVDKEPFFSIDIIELAYFLREKYNCTLSEALKTIMPSGVSVKENIFIRLVENVEHPESRGYEQIIQALSANKYINLNQLNKMLGFKVSRAQIFKMDSLGIIEVKREMKQNTNVKTIEIYSIGDIEKCNNFIGNHSPRLRRQAEILENLIENRDNALTMNEMCEKYKCTRNVVKALEEKELLVKYNKELYRNPFSKQYSYDRVELTYDQENSIENIVENYKLGKNITLIHGVTGCGKTEIYLNLVEKFMVDEHGSIVLVPEIALTPQTVERFRGRFGDTVAVIHSKLSDGERFDQWRRIRNGEVKVVVGARSAVLAPVKNLKLIVIDEEHEYSYKSEVTPKYQTREVAEFRIKQNNGLLVLGSATPSVESYHKALNNEYNLVYISKRIGKRELPEVKIVDMKDEILNGNKSMFSRELYSEIKENLDKQQQTILFLNRRGYSTFVSCRACGYVCKCNHCDVSLTYHIMNNKLSCHYCGSEASVPSTCPKCGSKYIKYFGSGTEKIESEIKKYFPSSRILRMDMDTTRKKGEHERIYNEFKSHKADILIGTQMVTKGMDFPGVTLVGVISADTTLNLPDFRSSERTFQLLTQVSGRAGRGLNPGRVVVQTYDPDNYSITFSKKHDYISFFNQEISIRRALNNPPFTDILYILFISDNEEELIKKCMFVKEELKNIEKVNGIEALGPSPCHISKIKNSYRWHMIFKGDVEKYRGMISNILFDKLNNTNVSFSIDINPYNMF
jgi:primosomal protein N' (replication factor Y) (superfamily II helicase)